MFFLVYPDYASKKNILLHLLRWKYVGADLIAGGQLVLFYDKSNELLKTQFHPKKTKI